MKIIKTEITDREHKKRLQRIGKAIAERHSQEIKELLAPGGKLKPKQTTFPFALLPSDFCRISPFFPLPKQRLKDRKGENNLEINSGSWGKIFYTGLRLSTYDEDVLLALLALTGRTLKKGEDAIYTGSLLKVLRLMGIKKEGTANYKRVLESLRLLKTACITIEASRKKGQRIEAVKGIGFIDRFAFYPEKKRLEVKINEVFLSCFGGGITRINCIERARLKSPISKNLYRFILSHRDDTWEGDCKHLSKSLNLDSENLPAFKIRERIKKAIKELIENSILTSGSGFLIGNRETVKLIRYPGKRHGKKTKFLKT